MKDAFIFESKKWIGEVYLEMEKGESAVPFYLSMEMGPEDGSLFSFAWEMHNSDMGNMLMQYVSFEPVDQNAFKVRLENEMFGIFEGEGYHDETFLGYEISDSKENFHCIEHFSRLDDGSIEVKGEYLIQDALRMHLSGRVTTYEAVAH